MSRPIRSKLFAISAAAALLVAACGDDDDDDDAAATTPAPTAGTEPTSAPTTEATTTRCKCNDRAGIDGGGDDRRTGHDRCARSRRPASRSGSAS